MHQLCRGGQLLRGQHAIEVVLQCGQGSQASWVTLCNLAGQLQGPEQGLQPIAPRGSHFRIMQAIYEVV